jgi:hypothetical protein
MSKKAAANRTEGADGRNRLNIHGTTAA